MAAQEQSSHLIQQRTAAPPSQTQTQTQVQAGPSTRTQRQPPAVLRLRGAHNSNARSVQWADDVVDNEGLGRKSSKVCCIYHRPKAVGESSDESSSDSSSGSDSDSDNGGKPNGHNHDHGEDCSGHGHRRGRRRRRGSNDKDAEKRPPSPNAYEKVPRQKPRVDADKGDKGKSTA